MFRIFHLDGELTTAVYSFHRILIPIGRNAGSYQKSLQNRSYAQKVLRGDDVHPSRRTRNLRNASPSEYFVIGPEHSARIGIRLVMVLFNSYLFNHLVRNKLLIVLPCNIAAA